MSQFQITRIAIVLGLCLNILTPAHAAKVSPQEQLCRAASEANLPAAKLALSLGADVNGNCSRYVDYAYHIQERSRRRDPILSFRSPFRVLVAHMLSSITSHCGPADVLSRMREKEFKALGVYLIEQGASPYTLNTEISRGQTSYSLNFASFGGCILEFGQAFFDNGFGANVHIEDPVKKNFMATALYWVLHSGEIRRSRYSLAAILNGASILNPNLYKLGSLPQGEHPLTGRKVNQTLLNSVLRTVLPPSDLRRENLKAYRKLAEDIALNWDSSKDSNPDVLDQILLYGAQIPSLKVLEHAIALGANYKNPTLIQNKESLLTYMEKERADFENYWRKSGGIIHLEDIYDGSTRVDETLKEFDGIIERLKK